MLGFDSCNFLNSSYRLSAATKTRQQTVAKIEVRERSKHAS